MSVIGIDLGTHVISLALHKDGESATQVIADDMGSRTIPSIIAYREGEIIIGQAALSQQNKNPKNTFDNVIQVLLYEPEKTSLNVPVLDKDVSIIEMASHLFRNIHNQVKQQVGSIVRDSVVVVNQELSETASANLMEAAKQGGIRIKAVLQNTTAAILGFKLDEFCVSATENVISGAPTTALVVDIGYSQTTASMYTVAQGVFRQRIQKQTTVCTAAKLVELFVAHCVKDFKRKYKMDCSDSPRCMLRLQRECVMMIKMLSTANEANMTIDSLYEGMDYQFKITRAKFEDLCTIPFMQLKQFIGELVKEDDAAACAGPVTHVCIVGGLSSVPRLQTLVRGCITNAVNHVQYPKLLNIDSSEVACVGAALHGVHLEKQGLLDSAMTLTAPADLKFTTKPLYLLSTPLQLESVFSKISLNETSALSPIPVVAAGAVLPYFISLPAAIDSSAAASGAGNCCFQVLTASGSSYVHLGEIAFETTDITSNQVAININIAVGGEITIVTMSGKKELQRLVIGV
jgi:heat shock 70kDa protein 1/2/6/8